ncbi:hypothetical protein EXV95_11120 [Acidovorax sp. JMULE5]|uniref:DUF5677 domain-containing protein n=1 Tax=Acidovorax sp. JMULE5 TaxID=2518343 RepID=UPI0015A3CB46|nr:DUF5677 domain-containing protein [Acidovorax sp. JMULE5]QLA81138.1 hypothetical protein EXV95_11120 [Acidovorax sp. JMULE5]
MSKRQLRQPEKALGADLATEISRACTALETAIELSQEPPPEHLQASKGWLAGNALWMRALSNCEVTLFLVEKGMDGPAWSNLRMAYECLFFACALWDKPENLTRIEDNHRIEKAKQARGLLKPGVYPAMTPERKASLEKIANGAVGAKEWKVFDAAFEVGMEYWYQMVYRGSSLAGAHATELSTNVHFEEVSEGVHSFYYGPRYDDAKFQVGFVQELLSCRIPDDCIDSKRYPLFMARAVLKELIESLQSTQGVKPC